MRTTWMASASCTAGAASFLGGAEAQPAASAQAAKARNADIRAPPFREVVDFLADYARAMIFSLRRTDANGGFHEQIDRHPGCRAVARRCHRIRRVSRVRHGHQSQDHQA